MQDLVAETRECRSVSDPSFGFRVFAEKKLRRRARTQAPAAMSFCILEDFHVHEAFFKRIPHLLRGSMGALEFFFDIPQGNPRMPTSRKCGKINKLTGFLKRYGVSMTGNALVQADLRPV